MLENQNRYDFIAVSLLVFKESCKVDLQIKLFSNWFALVEERIKVTVWWGRPMDERHEKAVPCGGSG